MPPDYDYGPSADDVAALARAQLASQPDRAAGISIRPVQDVGPPAVSDGGQFSGGSDWANRASELAQRFGVNTLQGLATLPQRAIENSQYAVDSGTYDPSVPVEAALTTMGTGGVAGVPLRAGEQALGSGAVRSKPATSFEPVDHDPFAADADPRISPRLPTAVKSTEDPLGPQRLQIDMEALQRDPALFEHNTNLLAGYPNLPLESLKKSNPEMTEDFINHAKDNLLYLHDMVDPSIRPRSSLWYEGGNKIANDMAQTYGSHPNSSAGALAALSPQKDWFQNVDLARRVHDIHYTKDDIPYTPEMETTAGRIYADPKFNPMLDDIRGKTYGELTDPVSKAGWLRLYDEAHNPRFHRLVTPEGDFGGPVLTQKGVPSGTGWGSLGEISKAIQSLETGGDVNKISGLMGERHKVRSFYNNLIAPHAPHGDVTMDTHAVAAALMRPLSGASVEVAHNFGNYAGKGLPNAKSSAVTGVNGTYPIYAEAYRRAAAERNLLPRQMQSITWEGVRSLFPDTFKTKKNVAAVDSLWHDYRNGVTSLDDTRAKILDLAGASKGLRPPDWHGR